MQGYDRSLSFIITQDPLESTVIEFWRMIKEQSITTLVMLSEIGEGKVCLFYVSKVYTLTVYMKIYAFLQPKPRNFYMFGKSIV